MHAKEYLTNMSDQVPKPNTPQRLQKDTSLTRSQVMRILMATTVGGSMLGLAGMTLTGTLIGLIIATPVLVLLSPVLVPVVAVLALITSGFLLSGSCLVGTIGVAVWTYRYVTGKPPLWAEKLRNARMKIANKANDVKEKAKECHEEPPSVQGS